jgi:hypothetical protein
MYSQLTPNRESPFELASRPLFPQIPVIGLAYCTTYLRQATISNRIGPLFTVKQKDIHKLKDKKHPIAEDEWERILTEVLLDRQSDTDIEMAAQVAEGQDMMLIIRRSISGIKVCSHIRSILNPGLTITSATHRHHHSRL